MTRIPQEARPENGDAPQRHAHLVQVRYADLDPLNHVNNVRMLTYLEEARISFLRWHGPEGETALFGDLVVARQEAEYLAPLLPRREPVRVETWVSEVRRAAFNLCYEVRDDAACYLRASTLLVGFDAATQRARRLSDGEREYLERHMAE